MIYLIICYPRFGGHEVIFTHTHRIEARKVVTKMKNGEYGPHNLYQYRKIKLVRVVKHETLREIGDGVAHNAADIRGSVEVDSIPEGDCS